MTDRQSKLCTGCSLESESTTKFQQSILNRSLEIRENSKIWTQKFLLLSQHQNQQYLDFCNIMPGLKG